MTAPSAVPVPAGVAQAAVTWLDGPLVTGGVFVSVHDTPGGKPRLGGEVTVIV
jgi:hypothetical protein